MSVDDAEGVGVSSSGGEEADPSFPSGEEGSGAGSSYPSAAVKLVVYLAVLAITHCF